MQAARVFIAVFLLAGTTACERTMTAAVDSDYDLRAAYATSPEDWPAPVLDSGVVHHELGILRRDQMVPPPPEADMIRDAKAAVALGRKLFFDPVLSESNQVSCGSCHDPDTGWGDGRRRAFGHDRTRGRRNAPSILNAGHWTTLFWDGRAKTLEEQVLGPLQDVTEMKQDLAFIGEELSAYPDYQVAFAEAFGVSDINPEKIAVAISAFERSVNSRTSRFDRFVNGKYDALDDREIRGLHLFRTKARCMNCHNGPLFTDQQFHNQGTHLLGRPEEDLGLYAITGEWADAGKFRTPMLRDITFTGPYLHHGNVAELREVIQMYNSGMPQIIPARVRKSGRPIPVHDPLLQPLGLTDEEIDDLLAFMGAISTRPRPIRIPRRVSK